MQEVHILLPIGSIIHERYVIEALLGQGGFGAVYLVRDQRVRGNLFALKEVLGPDKEARRRFLFEAEVLKKHDHPALPRVYQVFEDDIQQRAYMLMDYIEGPNLEQLRLQQPNERLSLAQMDAVLAPMIAVLGYLHTLHPPIIHRDIKPANIVVPQSGAGAVLVDFGIAKEYDEDGTTTAVRHASPGYGAPEQYGRGTNIATDIYGLGATCYTLLTGAVPVDALTRMTQVGNKEGDPLIPLETLVPGIPAHIASAIHRALALNLKTRFSSVTQFWDAIKNISPSASVASHADVPLAHLAKAVRPSVIANVVPTPSVITTGGSAPATPSNQRATRRKKMVAFVLLLLVLLLGAGVGLGRGLFIPSHSNNAYGVQNNKGLLTPTGNAVTVMPQHAATPTGITHTTPVSSVPTQLPTTGTQKTPVSGTNTTPIATSTIPVPQPTATSAPQPTPTPQPPAPTPTPAPAAYPHLMTSYSGVVDDTTAHPDIKASIFLSSIQQRQGAISGYFIVNQPLVGSNNFTGMVTQSHTIQFTVASYNGNAPLLFYGKIQSNGNISGSYCSVDASGRCNANVGAAGIWNVCPSSSNALPASTRRDLWYRLP